MTEEELKAIELLEEFKKTGYHTLMIKYNNDRIKTNTKVETAIETILNLVKKQQKEIEQWKKGFERELEKNQENTRELLNQDLIIRKKDKIIDEIIKHIHMLNHENGCSLGIHGFIDNCIGMSHCKKCLKQYFENKIEGSK